MRICVVHLISFIIIIIPLLLNIYYLFRNSRNFSDLHESLSQTLYWYNPRNPALQEMVQRSVSDHMSELDTIGQELSEIRSSLDSLSEIAGTSTSKRGQWSNISKYVNYADEKLGAQVQNVRAESIESSLLSSIIGLEHSTNPPINLLRSSMEPGNCYAFRNCQAELEIKLAKEAFVEAIEVEHIPKCLSPTKDTSSAPRNFSIFGIDGKTGAEIPLGDFEFTNNEPCQLFDLPVNLRFQVLRFKFDTNHGHPEYTCIYRIAVYGHPE